MTKNAGELSRLVGTPRLEEKVWTTPQGALRVEQLGPTVLRHTVCGVGTMGFYRPIVDSCNRVLEAQGKLVVLIDSWDQRRMESDFREELVSYLKGVAERDCTAVFLVQNPIVKMSMSIMNMLSGRQYFEPFDKVDAWEKRCWEYVPGMRRRPLVEVNGRYE